MREYIEERVIKTAEYILKTGATVRDCAKVFMVSKSTVHKDMSERLKLINKKLFKQVKKVLEKNKAERHIRGGLATYLKYKCKKNNTKVEKNINIS